MVLSTSPADHPPGLLPGARQLQDQAIQLGESPAQPLPHLFLQLKIAWVR